MLGAFSEKEGWGSDWGDRQREREREEEGRLSFCGFGCRWDGEKRKRREVKEREREKGGRSLAKKVQEESGERAARQKEEN